jgi:chitin deacetylase
MLFPFLLLSVPLTLAASIPSRDDTHDHAHHVNKRLPGNWYHSRDHPVHTLFKRAVGDGTDYAPVGSPGLWPQYLRSLK